MQNFHYFIFCIIDALLFVVTTDIPAVDPEYLDKLFMDERYEELSKMLKIGSPDILDPARRPQNSSLRTDYLLDDMLNAEKYFPRVDENEQPMNESSSTSPFNGSAIVKWTRVVPFAISRAFNITSFIQILRAVQYWNVEITPCIQWVPRSYQKNYVMILPGRGCFSVVGKVGLQQPLILQPGGYCFRLGSILHEMMHAVGFFHEHTRKDRDSYIRVLFQNIPPEWRIFFIRNEGTQFGLQMEYDLFSLMHYVNKFPWSDKPTFEVIQDGVDAASVGQRHNFSSLDKRKIKNEYCGENIFIPSPHQLH